MSQSHLPGHEQQPQEIVCASCGRFVGALPKCPHCGARVTARLTVRAFRYAAVLLSTVGLGLLYLMSLNREIPLIEIGGIKPTMNFAYVRVAGKVTDEARVNREGGTLRSVRFVIDDGTGEIPVTAFRAKGEELLKLDLLPRVGDKVDVTGSLSVSAESSAIWLQAPEQMILTRMEIPTVRLADVTEELLGSTVLVEGQIAEVIAPRRGSRRPWTLVLKDETGKRNISFWQDAYEELEAKVHLAPGTRLRAQVAVSSFRDELQLRLSSANDVTLLSSESSPGKPAEDVIPLSGISPQMEGKSVHLRGQVVGAWEPTEERAPFRIVLGEGDAEIPVVFWSSVASHLADPTPEPGSLLDVRGQVHVYSNQVQVKVQRADDLHLVASAGKP